MKKTSRILLILLTLALALSLFACTSKECKHIDEDGDGKCDKCNEAIEAETASVLLFDKGFPTFRFVIGEGVSKETKTMVNDYIAALEEIDLDVDAIADIEDDGEFECEILLGDVKSRGDKYQYDRHTLGNDGYAFKIIDKKIIVTAGSEDALYDAFDIFISDVLKFDKDTVDMGTVYMQSSQEVLEIQDDYKITALKVNDIDMKGYTIATHTSNIQYRTAATTIQDMLYDRTGYWFEIVSLDKASEKSIVLKSVDKIYGEDSFKIYANTNGQLVIECAFDNKLTDSIASFITANITNPNVSGDINFKGDVYKQDISFVTYEEFGAKGDGKTDDFEAMALAHEAANKYGQMVIANDKATYYIKDTSRTNGNVTTVSPIVIKTNVKWGNAKFIIDDRDYANVSGWEGQAQASKHIFSVDSDYTVREITDEATLNTVLSGDGIKPGVTKINLTFDYPVMIIPYDTTHTVYRRIGYGAAQGDAMHEVIVLDKDGNIDESTPVMFDYTTLKKIQVYRLDIEPITIEGGTFTTRASRINTLVDIGGGKLDDKAGYISRGIDVRRSFTTVKGVKHYVTDEVNLDGQIDDGKIVHTSSPYYGFFAANYANEVTFEDCIMSGRRCYTRPSNCIDGGTTGTYDLTGGNVNKLYYINCHQQNFWVTVDSASNINAAENREVPNSKTSMSSATWDRVTVKMHWGVGGTNFCKNMEYINSTLSRFDAHSGLYNGKIINSTVNYMALTGNGDFIVEDTVWYSENTGSNSASIFHLRADYGSTWGGKITVKNLDAYVHTSDETYLFLHSYANWYFGYIAAMPNLSLDNLNVYDISDYTPVRSGYMIYMMQNSVVKEPRMHLAFTASTPGKYCYIDLDKDGIVDETNVPYVDADKSNYGTGINLPSNDPKYLKNLNVIAPPEYLKIINNDGVDANGDGTPDGGYTFVVDNTTGKGIPAADDLTGLDPDVDPQGGFFATTKFYYGPGENDYCRVGEVNNGTFSFH